MFDLFSDPQAVAQQWKLIVSQFPFATWETLYSLVLEVVFAYVIGLPLGVLLVTGERDGIRPLPGWLMKLMNVVINLLRSVPFLILMIIALPLSKIIVGTKVGTPATIPPMVVCAFPLVARMVESRYLVSGRDSHIYHDSPSDCGSRNRRSHSCTAHTSAVGCYRGLHASD